MKKILIKESQLKAINESLEHDTYFDTFSSAVQYAREKVENKGYEIDEDDWWREVNTGMGRPKEGQTNRMSIGLIKDGKHQRKALHIQVYNMGDKFKKSFELNFYVS